jgi:hypothetical protein
MAVKTITGRPFLSCPSIDILQLSLTIMIVMIVSMSWLQKVVNPGGRGRGRRGGRAASQAGQRSRQHGVEVSAAAAWWGFAQSAARAAHLMDASGGDFQLFSFIIFRCFFDFFFNYLYPRALSISVYFRKELTFFVEQLEYVKIKPKCAKTKHVVKNNLTLQRQFRLYIPFLGIAWPQPQFPVSDLCIPRIGPHISSSRKGRPIVEIYHSLTDTWMWKLGLRPRYSLSGKICYKFSAFCLCSVAYCEGRS